ncbi:pilus assembly protein [Asticcacaulis sp. EMRT-3]|uniref:TadE/TadG family type IV pilus assembly protein n=1 Tax=Asticcacaulis sp. EMRT-3 TaxID=3040349 RepID=UPI0024AFD59F|nr:pilus assembly protein [Asticcacaulis sp. EMRT-3]MDI7773949.1 pilus assembly protein [Asticcacaulis sp. EMRT-3]
MLRNRAGSTIIMVALALPVIFLAVGGAIDFSRVLQLRGELQDAADVASVGSVAVNSKAFKLALTQGDGEISQGSQQAASIFESDLHPAPELSNITLNATVSKAATVITSLVTVSANYKPYIIGLFGFNSLPLSVTSKSSSTIPPYIDFYLLLDNTPSMGLGATTADINKLVAATANKSSDQNCAFACHLSGPGASSDYYTLAKSLGVTMRIDVVREATQNLMTTASNTETLPGQYRMALYDFGTAADAISQTAPTAYMISALNSNLTQSASDAGKIDLMTVPAQNYNSDRQTNFTSMLASMNSIIPASGDGTSAVSTQKVLFMVSDGLNDGYDCSASGCRRIAPLDASQCTALKNRGVRIAMLYTTYLLLPQNQNSFFDSNVRKYLTPTDQIATSMQACASPGLFFAVGPDQGISEAMTALFNKVVSVVRIRS